MQFYDYIFEHASKIVGQGVVHAPILIVLQHSGEVLSVLTSHASEDERAALFNYLAEHPDVEAVALILESWHVWGQTAEEIAKLAQVANARKLSECPERKEAIVISIMTATRQSLMLCPIDRTTNTLKKVAFRWIDARSELIPFRYVRQESTRPH